MDSTSPAEEYRSSLADLNCNSKPLINMLTILAEENLKHASNIVKTITDHVVKAPAECKLPCLYLIDSIVKNVRKHYLHLFGQNIVHIFSSVFEKVDENTRMLLYKLRQTWNEIFPNKILYALDMRVKEVDPAWPVTAQPPAQSIHINPKFLGNSSVQKASNESPVLIQKEEAKLKAQQNEVLKQLFVKQKQLRMLEEKKRELAAKQYISSDAVDVAATTSGTQTRTVDPRLVAKMNPKLSQRDPRLQKVVIASVLKRNLAQPKLNKETVQELPTPPDTSATRIGLVPPLPAVTQVCDNPNETLLKKKELPKPECPAPKPQFAVSEKENTDAKNERKMKDSGKRELSRSPSDQSSPSKKKKKKSPDSKKDAAPNVLPDKLLKGKVSKKIDIQRKSASKSPEATDSKKHKPHSKVPQSRVDKRATGRDDSSPKDKKGENGTRDLQQKLPDRKGKKLELKDEDTDLRKGNKEQEVRNKHGVQDDGKENFTEPPEKNPKQEVKKETGDDSLFGHEDQDYRQLSKDDKLPHHKGWAQYKATHPEEFKPTRRYFQPSINLENYHPSYSKVQKGAGKEKMVPGQFREMFYRGPAECDRLGRPRLLKMKGNERFPAAPAFYQREAGFRYPDRNVSSSKKFLASLIGDPKHVLRQAEEGYRLGRISEVDFNDIRRTLERMWSNDDYLQFKGFPDHNRMPYYGNMPHPDLKNFMNMPKGRMPENLHPPLNDMPPQGPVIESPPAVRTFRLDNKSRTLHFIDEQAIVLMDNGEPRELTFRGEATPVFIQGLKPITLRFDGKPVEFDLHGKICSMKFGTPSRELYINNRPYEGKFGGPPFDVLLNGKLYSVQLGGPPPQVQVSEHPAHDLYHKFLIRNRGNTEVGISPSSNRDHNVPGEAPRDHLNKMPFDVDMRSELAPNNRNSDVRDMDWRGTGSTANGQEKARSCDFNQNGAPPFSKEQPVGMGLGFQEQVRDHKEWDHKEEPGFRQYPHEQIPPRPSDWRNFPPQFHNVNRTFSPHHSPPHDGPPGEWQRPPHPPVSRPYDPVDQTAFEPPPPPWVPRDFNHDGPRPGHPPVSETGNAFGNQRNSPKPFEPYSKFNEGDPRGPPPPNFTMPMIPRPPFNRHPARPEFTERPPNIARLPRPPLPPWLNNPQPPIPLDGARLPVLPPPPRPPMHMQMSDSFIQALPPNVSESAAEVEANKPTTSVAPILPLSSTAALLLPSSSSNTQVVSGSIVGPEPSLLPIVNLPVVNLDVSALFEKLVAAGIISQVKSEPASDEPVVSKKASADKDTESKEKERDPNEEIIPPIELKLDTLRIRYSGVTSALYRGSQCATCGMRFKEGHGERYSRHLDWHFRVNRREKDGVKKAFSRKWYYEVEDWIQFEEFEDFEERARSFFELQADEQYQNEVEIEVPSVPVSGQETEACVVCAELFQLFWVEEEEEWHLRNAVRHDGQAYHPSCYEDFKNVTEAPVKDEPIEKEEIIPEDVSAVPVVLVKQEQDVKEESTVDYDSVTEVVEMLIQTTVLNTIKKEEEEEEEMEVEVKIEEEEEEEEIELQGKPGEEEIIGVISEADMEPEYKPDTVSEKVVFQSGGIIMKVRAESLKPASPMGDAQVSKKSIKEAVEESEEEEFRPPTPDPRFQVLPPVQRGTELSGLCRIM